MSFELTTLFGIGVGYLGLLFAIAFITEKGWIPQKVVSHPLIYVLSIGVFASVWAYYASVGHAMREGHYYLAPYIGISVAFLVSPLILKPILDITKTYQLSSLADLLAFRYRSPLAGTLTTLVMLIGVAPLFSTQIQAISDTVVILAPEASPDMLAFSFCFLITVFAISYGTGRGTETGREKHSGLVMAIAFESVVKLFALLSVGLFAVYTGFGSFEAMNQWVIDNPELSVNIEQGTGFSDFHLLTLLFFTAAVATPHMFYVTFNENDNPQALNFASWAVPLYFLLLALPVFPILWAGLQTGSTLPVVYFPVVIGLENHSELFALVGYIGGLSAASGLIIVITLALANMCLNHLILPVWQPAANEDIYKWLLWKRRALITAIIWSGFALYYLPDDKNSVQDIANVAFIAALQFLPAIVALLYWPQGNKKGYITGLIAGITIWFFFLMLPILTSNNFTTLASFNWRDITALSLGCNIFLFVITSMLSKSSDEERASADICSLDTIRRRRRRTGLIAKTPSDFIANLSKPLGEKTATREVLQALQDLKIDREDSGPSTMRLLRTRLEANLSGLLGPSISHELIDRFLPFSRESEHSSTDINVIEARIEAYRSNLSGMAADLDNLRRYHRQILLDLPLGVCSLGPDGEIVIWNHAMEALTGIIGKHVVGSQLSEIPEPWHSVIHNFTVDSADHVYKQNIQVANNKRCVNLHKASIEKSVQQQTTQYGMIILLEDLTETELLEEELTHSERLASIGRLAAGVAHEIGNPITGIACLAQNMREEIQDDELRNMANQIIEQTDRTSRILQSLVNFAHAGTNNPQQNKEIVDIRECVDEAITLISLDKKSKDLDYIINCAPESQIIGDSQRLLQVMVNLINNAQDASPVNSTITIKSEVEGDTVQISVIDQGVGIAEAIRDKVFEPFFTTKEPGEGTGLGLSLVYSIVEDLGGHIEIVSPASKDLNHGTRVNMTFPCYHGESLEQSNNSDSKEVQSNI